jgi:hypothetical protein
MPEIMGGGAALADVDGDGDLDLYLVQSGTALVDEDPDTTSPANRLYLNRGDGRFDPAPAGHGAGDRGYGMGATVGDYDNDGDVDIYVTNVGANALLRNDGTGRFENVAAGAGVDDERWGTAAAFLDLDADGDLDLFLVNYINWTPAIEMPCYADTALTYCSPQSFDAPAPDRLYRNNGDGTFTDVSEEAGLQRAFGNGMGVVGADFDGNGHTDVFVANDMTFNQLWLNDGQMRFTEEALFRDVAVDEHGSAKAGMGIAAADVDDDADTDLLVVNLTGQTDSFFRNEGTHFVDATAQAGLATISRKFTRFGVVFADFDNDGWLDVYEANGKIMPRRGEDDDPFAEPNVLFRGLPNARFEVVDPAGGTAAPLVHTSRGLAVGDINNDGGLDLVVVNRDASPYVLVNQVSHQGNWIRFRLIERSGRDAHGARISVDIDGRRVHREVQPSGSYLASHDPRVHVGLGKATMVQAVTVRWADGTAEHFGDYPAKTTAELKRGAGTALDR